MHPLRKNIFPIATKFNLCYIFIYRKNVYFGERVTLERKKVKEYFKIPTERLAKVCNVSINQVLSWRAEGVIPPEHHELLEKSGGFEFAPAEGAVLRVSESPDLMIVCEPTDSHSIFWKLALVPETSRRFLGSNTPMVNLADWLVESAMAIKTVDIIWSQTKLTLTASGRPNLTIAYGNGLAPVKIRLDSDLQMLFLVDVSKEAKRLYGEVGTCLNKIINMAQEVSDKAAVQEILNMADMKPEELFQKYLNDICTKWVDRHVLGPLDEDGVRHEPEPMYTSLGGTRYQGHTLFTTATFGTYFRELGRFAEDDTLLYTGNGFLQGGSFLENLERDGLGRLVPPFPAHMVRGAYESTHWILPEAHSLVIRGLKVSGHDISPSAGLRELQNALLNIIHGTVSGSQAKIVNPSAGITYLDDEAVTMAKINKQAFHEFNSKSLSTPFKVFTQHFGAGASTFWAMLFSSLIPTQTCRKQALLLFGSGGSFKTTFIEKVYARMLAGTIRKTPGGKYKFTRGTNTFDIMAKTRTSDAMSASEFGEVNTPNNVLMFFEEAVNYNSEWSTYQNLKKQLGASSITINVKYARNRKTLPVSRTVVVDSNYPPCSFEWSKESVDRAAECVLFSQYALVPPNETYCTCSDNHHLYFQKLLSQGEIKEMSEVIEFKGQPTEEDYLDYLAFLLFRDIMTVGKRAYQELTGEPIQYVPLFLPFNPDKYDRKGLALSYCKLMNLSKLGRNFKEAVVTPATIIMYFLRAGIKVTEEGFISWKEIEDILSSKFYPEIKPGIDIKHSSKKDTMSWAMGILVQSSLLGNDGINRFIGNESPNIRVYSDTEGVHNVSWEPWFIDTCNNADSGLVLRSLQKEVCKILQDTYINKMCKHNLEHLIPRARNS